MALLGGLLPDTGPRRDPRGLPASAPSLGGNGNTKDVPGTPPQETVLCAFCLVKGGGGGGKELLN